MAWSKPMSDVEVAYIEKSFPKYSCAEIAQRLGRSTRCVQKNVARLGLRERCAPAPARDGADACRHGEKGSLAADDGGEEPDELAELLWLKRVLKSEMRDDPGPAAMAKLSSEFQSVVKRISEIRGGDYGDGGSRTADVGNILVAVPLRPA